MILITASFIPDNFHELFGDWHCVGTIELEAKNGWQTINNGCKYESCDHDPTWHWGFRHWLWLLMGICLFIIQVIRIVCVLISETEKTTNG
jgi:hypothetical protein